MNQKEMLNVQHHSELVRSSAYEADNAISNGNIKEGLILQARMMLALAEQLRWLGMDGDQAEQLSYVLNVEAMNPRFKGG